MSKKLSLIIPCYNEEEVIELSINTMINSLKDIKETYELIFVDDGSKDRTLEILKGLAASNKNIKVISLSRNFGQQPAIRAGLENATGDYIGFIDADLQDPPHLIPKMIEKIEEGYDVVYGQREKRLGESKFKLFTASAYYKLFNWLSDVPQPQNVSDFRIITRQVADVILSMKEQNQTFRALIAFAGFKQTGILFERPERAAGETKYTLKKMFKLAEDGIIGFSTKPLRLPLAFAFLSAAFLVLNILLNIFGVYISTMFMLNLYMCLLFGTLGIFGIYLTKIYENSKGRPIYIIREKINFD